MDEREREILSQVLEILKKRLSPERIILFGSRSKGTARTTSDFDFAVESSCPAKSVERELMEEIEQAAGLYSVDIIYLNEVDSKFRDLVNQTGKVVYERGA